MSKEVKSETPDEFEQLWTTAIIVPAAYLHQVANWPGVMSLEKSLVPQRIGEKVEMRMSLRASVMLFKKEKHRMIIPMTNFSTILLKDA